MEIPVEFKGLFDNNWRESAIWGGRFGLKSHSIARYLLIKARQDKTKIACFREFQNSIADSSYQLLVDLINYYDLKEFKVTDKTIINMLNGSDFIFKGLHLNEQSIKSIEGIDIAWCFVAGTMIDNVPIENIKPGDYVSSYSHKNYSIDRKRVLRVIKRPKPKKLFRLLTSHGLVDTIATGEHPFYVKGKGYTPIQEIKKGDIVYEKVKFTRSCVLSWFMWRYDRDKHTLQTTEVCQKWWTFLLGLCKKALIRKDENEQPNGQHIGSSKNEKKTKRNRTWSKSSWRERKGILYTSKLALQKTWSRLVERTGSKDRRRIQNAISSDKLQDRLGKCILYVGNRMRWISASWKKIKRGRCKENCILREVRVENVEVQEQGYHEQHRYGDARDYVYNLEVEINNNYFANDILVHNCEEAQTLSKASLEVLTPTVRKPGSKIIYTYNRLLEDDPVHQRLIIEGRPDTLKINVNYDVAIKYHMMPDVILKEIEDDKKNRPALYKHKWLGEPNSMEKKIYNDWQIIDEIPHEARLERYGLDFGYTNDPCALVAVYKFNDGYILDEHIYSPRMANSDIASYLLNVEKALTVADSAEPKSIAEIASRGVLITKAQKGADSKIFGIHYVQDQKISVTKKSTNIIKEYRSYLWKTDNNDRIINDPIDENNHCFVGDTLISTSDGLRRIETIKIGEMVYTSKGYKPVLKRWNNGIQRVNKYSLQFDTFTVIIEATKDHLIKTSKGWKKISELQLGMTIYLNNYLWVKSIDYIQKKDIFHEARKECTPTCGSTFMDKYLMGIIFIIKTKILGIIELITLLSSKVTDIYQDTQKKDLSKTQTSANLFNKRALLPQKLGTVVKREEHGIANKPNYNGAGESARPMCVYGAKEHIKQDIKASPSFVTKTAKLRHFEIGEENKQMVYDLTVNDCHEYFANGILVHNCMDAIRYAITSIHPDYMNRLSAPKFATGDYVLNSLIKEDEGSYY